MKRMLIQSAMQTTAFEDVIAERETEEFTIDIPSKYHPGLMKRALFKDQFTEDDCFLELDDLNIAHVSPTANSSTLPVLSPRPSPNRNKKEWYNQL